MAQLDFQLVDFTPFDAGAVNQVALAAFLQYRQEYADWPGFSKRIANVAALAESAELIVAKAGCEVCGAVAYLGPGKEKAPLFEPEWAVLRMLVVDPEARGLGIGRRLAQECINRAVRDGAPVIALHTSPIMRIARSLYESLGFRFEREVPPICGVPYGIYVLKLSETGMG